MTQPDSTKLSTKAKRCVHDWQKLLPDVKSIAEENQAEYWVVVCLQKRLIDMFYCKKCNKTAHVIKSRRSGLRVHHTDYFLNEANAVREQFGLQAL